MLAAMGVDDVAAQGSLRLTIGAETTDAEVERAARDRRRGGASAPLAALADPPGRRHPLAQ